MFENTFETFMSISLFWKKNKFSFIEAQIYRNSTAMHFFFNISQRMGHSVENCTQWKKTYLTLRIKKQLKDKATELVNSKNPNLWDEKIKLTGHSLR